MRERLLAIETYNVVPSPVAQVLAGRPTVRQGI
jgi:hypothetical protein